MKNLRVACLVVVLLAFFQNLYGQGFVDLDFESPTLVTVGWSPYVSFAQAFPGWSESAGTLAPGGTLTPIAVYDGLPIDSADICIMDTHPLNAAWLAGAVMQGNYSAILAAGIGSSSLSTDVTLSQTGLIPVGTESLQFKANGVFYSNPSGAFTVTLGGQTLSLTVLGTGTNYTLYGANVSQWAGQTADLAFTEFAENPHREDTYLGLDAIQFSPEAIPEPSVIGLVSISVLFLCWRMKWPNYSLEPPPIEAASPHSRFTSRIRRGSRHGR